MSGSVVGGVKTRVQQNKLRRSPFDDTLGPVKKKKKKEILGRMYRPHDP